jgi:hypothetical protein
VPTAGKKSAGFVRFRLGAIPVGPRLEQRPAHFVVAALESRAAAASLFGVGFGFGDAAIEVDAGSGERDAVLAEHARELALHRRLPLLRLQLPLARLDVGLRGIR